MPIADGDWESWGNHVLASLKAQEAKTGELQAEITKLRVDLAGIKVRIGMLSAIAGGLGAAIPTIIMIVLKVMEK